MRMLSRTIGFAILIVASTSGMALAEERERKAWDQATASALLRPYVPDHLTVGEPLNRYLRDAKNVGLQTALIILPVFPITAAPNQPEIKPNDTRGIINALCDVQLYIVGCSFTPNAATINCDSNGDGIDDLVIPLKDIQILNRNLVRVTVPALGPQLPGTAFPLSCCGGIASLTLIQHVGAGDDNIFGEFTQKTTCDIDLGLRAPVVLSSSPGGGNCATTQDLLIPGACFVFADGTRNVTSVFAVEVGNLANVIQAKSFTILSNYLLDAFFDFGAASAGKSFLIFASGPNGTSRNLTTLPPGAPAGCPLGNEQGLIVTVACDKPVVPGDTPTSPPPSALVAQCQLERTDAGSFLLVVSGQFFKPGAQVTVGGAVPRKVKMKDPDPAATNTFTRLILKGNFCASLPGIIVVTNPNERSSQPFQCNRFCAN